MAQRGLKIPRTWAGQDGLLRPTHHCFQPESPALSSDRPYGMGQSSRGPKISSSQGHVGEGRQEAWCEAGGGGSCCTAPVTAPESLPRKGVWDGLLGPAERPHEPTAKRGLGRRGSVCAQDIRSRLTTRIPEHPWLHPLLMDAKASVNTTKETQCLLARTLHNNTLDPSTGLFQEPPPLKEFILYCVSLGSVMGLGARWSYVCLARLRLLAPRAEESRPAGSMEHFK